MQTIIMTLNYPKLCSGTLASGSWFHLSFEHSDFISIVDKSTDHSDLRYFRNKNETRAS